MQGCVHCEGQILTELKPSTCLNPELRSSNRVQPSRLGLNQYLTNMYNCRNLPIKANLKTWWNILFIKKECVLFLLKMIFIYKSCNYELEKDIVYTQFKKNIIVLKISGKISQMSGSNCKVNFILYGGNDLRQGNISKSISWIRLRDGKKRIRKSVHLDCCLLGVRLGRLAPVPRPRTQFVVSQCRTSGGDTVHPTPEAGIRCH